MAAQIQNWPAEHDRIAAVALNRVVHAGAPLLREAAPILREAGLIFWLYDKFALRLALNGRQSDAAVVAGFAFAVLEKSGRSGEPLAVQVRERLYSELRGVMSDDVIRQLVESGKHLTEERALALALDH